MSSPVMGTSRKGKRGQGILPRQFRARLANVQWNKIIYDRISELEKGEESTKPQKPLRLGTKQTFRKRLRTFRVRVKKLRVRIRISPHLWLKKFCDAYVNMMLGMQEQLRGGGGMVLGFHTIYPLTQPTL